MIEYGSLEDLFKGYSKLEDLIKDLRAEASESNMNETLAEFLERHVLKRR